MRKNQIQYVSEDSIHRKLLLEANKLNIWTKDVPGDVVTPGEHMVKLSKHRYHINTDLSLFLP